MLKFAECVQKCAEVGASDLHICAGYPPSMRHNGSLEAIDFEEPLTPAECTSLAYEILNPIQIDALKKEGEIDFAYSVDDVRLRVNVYQQSGTTAIAARLLRGSIPSIEELELPEALVNLQHKRHGLILVTGITGSGKSTTLAALVQLINKSFSNHIITIEEPIEYVYPKGKAIINQREIGTDCKSFANALRAALREDPDVILVGEMRDNETIATALSAAETGHLVLSTLHTIDVAGAVDRMIDSFPAHQQSQIRSQIADVLECVVSQQLIPRIDKDGRVVATELMLCNSAIRAHIREGKTFQIPNTISTSRKQGMMLMDDCIYELYVRGKISGANACAFAHDRDAMSKKVI